MKKEISNYVSQELLNKQVSFSDSEDLFTSGVIDSLGLMRLISFIEENYKVKVNPADMTIDNFGSIDAIVDYLVKEKNGN